MNEKEADELVITEAEYELDETDSKRPEEDEAEQFALKIIKSAASLKAVKIDRGSFLRSELKKHCPDIDVDLAISETPALAGTPPEVLDKIACSAIDLETKKCAGLSFAAGIPGGLAMVGTVPADLAQYFAHVMRIEQKLAYVYGWQTFLDDGDEIDDETIMQLIVLMGVMMNVGSAANTLTKFTINVAQKGVAKTIQRQALTKTTFYPIMESVLRVIGVQLTKETFAKTVSKVVPVIGGAVSGGLTYATFKPGAERLRKYLRSLPMSGVEADAPEAVGQSFTEDAVSNTDSPISSDASAHKANRIGASIASRASTAGSTVANGAVQVGSTIAGSARDLGKKLSSLRKR